ncbi:hypothetical protein Vadar_009924 [Vaccinium darrowii]|uniref:Uncharacterized protein n=1 Tax=Vaccinium darrowii TaxID=229202 RepID=A0ACB7XHN1_9ERIC|nr:hypothetical protein Vadar_009924 [Vaccinium darrowii]
MEPGNGDQHEGEGSGQGIRAIERILAAMARQSEQHTAFMLWQNQQATAAGSGTGLLEKFKKLFPTEFEGTINPEDAENWLKTVERVLMAMGVTDEQKVTLATFSLKGEALLWWEASQRLLSAPLPDVQPPVPQVITWARFVQAFNDQYFPEAFKFEQEAMFITLDQEKGKMTVPEYEAKFNALSRYASDLVDTDEKKCRQFRAGLERNVRTRLTSYKQASYADLVDMARQVGKDVEQMLNEREQVKRIKTEASQASRASKFGGYYRSDSKFQHQKGRNDSKQQSGQGQGTSRPSMGRGGSSSGRGTSFQCYRCGSPEHGIRDCPEVSKGVKCYNCGEMGHISKQCLKPRASATSSTGSAFMGRGATSSTPVGRGGGTSGSTAPGRVYAMTRQHVQASPEVQKRARLRCRNRSCVFLLEDGVLQVL